jgi:lipoate---protein ligase
MNMEHQAPAAPSGATGAEVWGRYPLEVAPAGLQVERALGMIAEGAPLPALCWYWAVEPTLILGVFQPPEVINEAAAAARGVPLVRRRSGGTGVLAGPPLLSLDIALPPGHRLALPDVTESYHWLGRAWLATMEALGVRGARLVPIAEVRAAPHRPLRRLPDGPIPDEDLVRLACFGALSPYEVAIGPRKLVGFSQVRRRAGLLLQVGLPLTWEADLLAALLAARPDDRPRLARLLRAHAVGLDELLPTVPAPQAIMAVFEQVLAADWGVRLAPITPRSGTQDGDSALR